MSLADDIAMWMTSIVHDAGANGVLIGLSGGIDSAVAGALAARAMPGHVLGAILPCESDPTDAEHARLLATTFDIETVEVDLTATYTALMASLPEAPQLAIANVKPRLRMTAMYFLAASRGYLVCGASNRSERSIGYFTKFGDGGADLFPIGGLLKFEVRQLARKLGVPQRIIDKPPSAGLWPGQTDEAEMKMSYGQLDAALRAMDSKDPSAIPAPIISRVRQLMSASAHKRGTPPVFLPRREPRTR